MTTLVAPSDLAEIIEVPSSASDGTLQAFINTADLIVTEELSTLGLSVARLTQIELYMAAHFATLLFERGGLTGSRTGESADTYQKTPTNAVGFLATRFGQQAVLLDTSGTLLAMSSQKLSALFTVFRKRVPPGAWIDPESNTTLPGYWGYGQ
jgi:hypothetical protein